MNLMFVIDGKLITPPVSTTILAGITRDSVLQVAKDLGYVVEERKVAVEELAEAYKAGKLQEAFGTGTAATIAQIATIHFNGEDMDLPAIEGREISNRVATELDKIKTGQVPDKHNWVHRIPSGSTVYCGHEMRSLNGRPFVAVSAAGGRAVFLDTGAGKGGHLSWIDLPI